MVQGLDLFDLFDLFDEFKPFLGHQTQVPFLLEGDLVPKLEPRMLDICTSQPSQAISQPPTAAKAPGLKALQSSSLGSQLQVAKADVNQLFIDFIVVDVFGCFWHALDTFL